MYFFRRFVYYVNKMVVFQLIPSRIVEFVISIFFLFVCHRSQLQTMTGAPLKSILHNISPRCSAQSKCWNDVEEILAKTIETLACGVCMCWQGSISAHCLLGFGFRCWKGMALDFLCKTHECVRIEVNSQRKQSYAVSA